ncbi:MAG: patatin-like phospholipase family protein [Methylococcales bacterium]|nr:patatin-like phospholipase family protein [Methylococcales bacterium]
MSRPISANVDKAKKVIAGERIDSNYLLDLEKKLKNERAFGLARRMLEKHHADYLNNRTPAPDETLQRKLTHELSLCTYKDPDLNPLEKLDRALEILKSLDNLDIKSKDCTKDEESLGQAGAIFKRKWELTNQRVYLDTSLAYYARGHAQGISEDADGPVKDRGYTGINAAFVLDLLAGMETNGAEATAKAKQARKIREDIVTVVPGIAEQPRKEWLKQEWWFLVTIAEAYFGLKRYEDARPWLQQAAALPDVPEWAWETTARQLARLLQLLEKNETPAIAKDVLAEFLGDRVAGLNSLLKGKIGLALSGGGFRASLFHIGMLAKLAELDLLRGVEYLSCVSGGSIIGAHYYLEARNLLQSKTDAEITREDYIAIVERVQKDFLDGVQTNVRVQVASEWMANAKMIYSSGYSRTNRLGELYEEQIFSRIKSPETPATEAKGAGKLLLNELKVEPKGEAPGFSPKDQNWRRAAKVPILVLNATPLNTGHNWQFTTTWMGEPPVGAGSAIDTNYRLRRMYYEDAPEPHKEMRLGYAVAASSCVPGLFEPLPLVGLYPDKIVQLIDGGVHDNQGTAALLEQGCNVLLVSDASGQMDQQDEPNKGLLGVPLRANSILQARLRESQYHELDAWRRSGLLQGLMFIHLKAGLESLPVDWIDCQDLSDPITNDPLLPYGIQRKVQQKLAAIRTDLDSFSETEAYALMTCAYRMTEYAFRDSLSSLGFETSAPVSMKWTFLELEDEMRKPGSNTPLLRQLRVADKLFLKIWLLSKPLQLAGILILVVLLALLAFISYAWWSVPFSTTWGKIVSALFTLALGATVWKPIAKFVHYRKTAEEILIGIGMVFLGSWLAKIHLKVFDRLFLAQGSLKGILKRSH